MSFISKQSVMDIIQTDEYFHLSAIAKALYHAMLCSCTVGGVVKNARVLGAITDIGNEVFFDDMINQLLDAGFIEKCEGGFYICNWPKICDPEFRED